MKPLFDPNMLLTEHFTLGEMLRSETAEQNHINNTPLKSHITALQNLCVRCLEPTRRHFNLPICVNSGFRSIDLNKALHGADASQHMKGIRTLLIDPFNYVDLPVLTGANDTQKITHVLRQIVNFAHNEKVLVILVAHPKKPQVEGGHKQDSKMPSLYDIAGSADFYNKCDYGLILQRQSSSEYTKLALTWIHVLKIRFRHLGQIGARAFGFDTSNGRFVGTANDNLTLQERDRTDWSYREAEQQQLEFEDLAAPEPPEDDLPV